MTDILIMIFVAICVERIMKYRVKKTDANTESWGRSVTSVKQLWRWEEKK